MDFKVVQQREGGPSQPCGAVSLRHGDVSIHNGGDRVIDVRVAGKRHGRLPDGLRRRRGAGRVVATAPWRTIGLRRRRDARPGPERELLRRATSSRTWR